MLYSPLSDHPEHVVVAVVVVRVPTQYTRATLTAGWVVTVTVVVMVRLSVVTVIVMVTVGMGEVTVMVMVMISV